MEEGDIRMSSVDDRIVNMEFNNKQFTQGVNQTERDLTNLEKSLSKAGKSEGLTKMGGAAQVVSTKFSALQVAGVAAIATIASKATMFAGKMLKSFTLDPIMQGFEEYNTNLQSIQTVMANTGASVQTVNGYMQTLNQYSDKTIYNFSEMARNIGTFTAAGVGLKDAVSSIQGISNMAALSGSTSQQASSAMYQLSQAIAAGRVSLQDWNSVVNAGMGGKNLQKALITTGMAMGQINEKVDLGAKNLKIAGESFRESISTAGGGSSWLTSDVLVKTFALMDGRLSKASIAADHLGWSQKRVTKAIEEQQAALRKQGYTDEQINQITDMADRAYESATVVKTLPQLLGVVKESLGSVWAQAFQGIIGNFNQSKKLWTSVSNSIGEQVRGFGHSLVGTIDAWRKAGGRTDVLTGLEAGFSALGRVVDAVKLAFREVFPPVTGKQLAELSHRFAEFMSNLVPGIETIDKLKRIFAGFFAVFSIGWQIIKQVAGVIGDLLGTLSGGAGGFLDFAAGIGDMLVAFDEALKKGDGLENFFDGLTNVLKVPLEILNAVAQAFFGLFGGFDEAAAGAVEGTVSRVSDRLEPMASFAEKAKNALTSLFENVSDLMQPVLDAFSNFGAALANSFSSGSFEPVFDAINTGLFAGLVFLVKRLLDNGLSFNLLGGAGEGMFESITEGFQSLTGTMEAMQTKLKADALIRIAAAIAIMTASLVVLSLIDSRALTKALIAMSVGFGVLVGTMAVLEKLSMSAVKMPFIAASMVLLATSILILSGAIAILANLSWEELLRGLSGIGGALVAIAIGMKLMPKGMLAQSVALMALAVALNGIALAIKQLSGLSWEELSKGITGVGGAIAAIAIAMRLMPKGIVLQAAALLILAGALQGIAAAIGKLGAMNLETLGKGIGAVAVALGAIGLAMQLMPLSLPITAAGLVLVAVALSGITKAIGKLGGMSLKELGKGIGAVAASLLVIGLAMQAMPLTLPITAAGLVLVAIALQGISKAVMAMSGMTWEEIAKGLVALGGSLAIIAAGLYLMSGAVGGAAALLITAAALAIFVPVLERLGNLSIETIITGLAALAAAFLVLGAAGYFLGPSILLLGVGLALIGAGLALAGAGMLAFSTGFAILAATGAAGIGFLMEAFDSFLIAIPKLSTALAQGFVKFVQTIGQNAPKLRKAFGQIFESFLGVVEDAIPNIASLLSTLIDAGLSVVEKGIPRYAEAGMKIIIGLLDAMEKHIPKIVDKATNLIITFIETLGDNAVKLANAGADMVIDTLNGLAEAVRTKGPQIREAARNLVSAFAEQIRLALADMIPNIPIPDLPIPKGLKSLGNTILPGNPLGRRAAGSGRKNLTPEQRFLKGLADFSKVFATQLENVATVIEGASALLVGASSGKAFDLAQSAAGLQSKATSAQTTADVQDKLATRAQNQADKKVERAENLKKQKNESKAHFKARRKKAIEDARSDKKTANKATKLAERTAKAAADIQAQADAERQKAMDEAAVEQATKRGDYEAVGDIRSQQGQDIAAQAQAMMASAQAKAAEAARIAKKNGAQAKKLREQAAKEAAEAATLAKQANDAQAAAIAAYAEARRLAAKSVIDRMNELRQQQIDEEKARQWDRDYEAASTEGKISMLEARAAENDAKAQAARAALQTAYAQSDALAAAIARGETVSEAQLAAVQAALAEAEKQSQIASTAADQAQQDRDQIEQLRQQQAQDNASGGTQSGAQITPSRTALEDAALAVDRYTASVAQAEEAAMAGASAPQFVQNNYSPEALSASEIYRQTKNLTSAAEIKMGVPTG